MLNPMISQQTNPTSASIIKNTQPVSIVPETSSSSSIWSSLLVWPPTTTDTKLMSNTTTETPPPQQNPRRLTHPSTLISLPLTCLLTPAHTPQTHLNTQPSKSLLLTTPTQFPSSSSISSRLGLFGQQEESPPTSPISPDISTDSSATSFAAFCQSPKVLVSNHQLLMMTTTTTKTGETETETEKETNRMMKRLSLHHDPNNNDDSEADHNNDNDNESSIDTNDTSLIDIMMNTTSGNQIYLIIK